MIRLIFEILFFMNKKLVVVLCLFKFIICMSGKLGDYDFGFIGVIGFIF